VRRGRVAKTLAQLRFGEKNRGADRSERERVYAVRRPFHGSGLGSGTGPFRPYSTRPSTAHICRLVPLAEKTGLARAGHKLGAAREPSGGRSLPCGSYGGSSRTSTMEAPSS
jgi:hypothetical protein